MTRHNITQMAKKAKGNSSRSWVYWADTYGVIKDDELAEQDLKGYDLIQISDNNQHVGFEWEKREEVSFRRLEEIMEEECEKLWEKNGLVWSEEYEKWKTGALEAVDPDEGREKTEEEVREMYREWLEGSMEELI